MLIGSSAAISIVPNSSTAAVSLSEPSAAAWIVVVRTCARHQGEHGYGGDHRRAKVDASSGPLPSRCFETGWLVPHPGRSRPITPSDQPARAYVRERHPEMRRPVRRADRSRRRQRCTEARAPSRACRRGRRRPGVAIRALPTITPSANDARLARPGPVCRCRRRRAEGRSVSGRRASTRLPGSACRARRASAGDPVGGDAVDEAAAPAAAISSSRSGAAPGAASSTASISRCGARLGEGLGLVDRQVRHDHARDARLRLASSRNVSTPRRSTGFT